MDNISKRNALKPYIERLKDLGFTVNWITKYQVRINDRLDIFPTSRKYHDIATQKRGIVNCSIEQFVCKLFNTPELELKLKHEKIHEELDQDMLFAMQKDSD